MTRKDNNKETYIIWPHNKSIIKSKDNWITNKNTGNNKFRREEAPFGKIDVQKYKNE